MTTIIFIPLSVLVLILAVFDVLSTEQAFKRGAREANPVMAWFQRLMGRWWAVPRMGFAGLVIWVASMLAHPFSIIVMAAAVCLYGFVVKNNFDIAWGKT